MSIKLSGVRIRPAVNGGGGGGGNITYDDGANDINLALLLHCEGGPGSTVINDNSYGTKTLTAHGNAQISTSKYKYGAGSLSFDGTPGTYVSAAQDSAFAFGTGDFTVEMWVWLNSYGSGYNPPANPEYGSWMFDTRSMGTGSPGISFGMRHDDGRLLTFYNSNIQMYGTTGLSLGIWTHLAFVRSGNTLYFYVNGVLDQSGPINYNFTTDYCFLGTASDLLIDPKLKFDGYMDEVRVTKGYARYTGTFTPPASSFPNYTPLTTSYPSPGVGDTVVSYNSIYLCTGTGPATWIYATGKSNL